MTVRRHSQRLPVSELQVPSQIMPQGCLAYEQPWEREEIVRWDGWALQQQRANSELKTSFMAMKEDSHHHSSVCSEKGFHTPSQFAGQEKEVHTGGAKSFPVDFSSFQ